MGLCVKLSVSRFSAAVIAWLLGIVGLVTSISVRTVQRWLAAERLKPWQFRSWITPKNLKTFPEPGKDILDLYERVAHGLLGPGEVVHCLDEKTSIQARSRANYSPPREGEPARVEHTYERLGAVQLYGSLDVAAGRTFEQVQPKKDFATFSRFLAALIGKAVAAGARIIHLIMDNGSLHRPEYLSTWLAEWLRDQGYTQVKVVLHWLPPRSSWLNQVAIIFSLVQTQVLMPNNCASTDEVAARILAYLALRNQNPRPVEWTCTSAQLCKKYDAAPSTVTPASPTRVVAA